jgi:hypothetical protein
LHSLQETVQRVEPGGVSVETQMLSVDVDRKINNMIWPILFVG